MATRSRKPATVEASAVAERRTAPVARGPGDAASRRSVAPDDRSAVAGAAARASGGGAATRSRGRSAGATPVASAGTARAHGRAGGTRGAAGRDEGHAASAPVDAPCVPAPREDARPAPGRAAGLAPVTRETRWVRQACAMTESEYAALSLLKKRASSLARPAKRGELLRVGLQWLASLDDAALFEVLGRTPVARR